MYDPEEEFRPVTPRTQSEQTDRVNGEYHYKNGYTQRIYSDRRVTIHRPKSP